MTPGARRGPGRAHETAAIREACTKLGTEHLVGITLYVLAHPCPMCLGSLYYCSPDEVVFLTTRDAYKPHYVDDRKYFELDTVYDEFAKDYGQRRLPVRYDPQDSAVDVHQLCRRTTAATGESKEHRPSERQGPGVRPPGRQVPPGERGRPGRPRPARPRPAGPATLGPTPATHRDGVARRDHGSGTGQAGLAGGRSRTSAVMGNNSSTRGRQNLVTARADALGPCPSHAASHGSTRCHAGHAVRQPEVPPSEEPFLGGVLR
ncbi:deaminase [Streptomyces sp. NBC_01221]|uniref:deaminase n=1 Tax=unclassified Streptomyces TaxID=2593676 RepID=UPI0022570FD1|nr:deaminase [Streptomyces sp. NBC_01221]MCX4790978.1 deaminase [Streptomyces sp. NBC_01221]